MMSPHSKKTPNRWSEDEDRVLWEEACKQSAMSGTVKDWKQIASKLPNRTNRDCRKRWVNSVAARYKKGPWDEVEDKRLEAAIQIHGKKWTLVANDVGHRTPDQCAKRWQCNLDPKLEHGGWTTAEDALLLSSVKEHGTQWKLIQEMSYPTRSRNDLKNRYHILSRRFGVPSSAIEDDHDRSSSIGESSTSADRFENLSPGSGRDAMSETMGDGINLSYLTGENTDQTIPQQYSSDLATMPDMQYTLADDNSMMDIDHLILGSTYQPDLSDYPTNAETSHHGISSVTQFSAVESTVSSDATNVKTSEGSSLDSLARDDSRTWRKVSLVVEDCDTSTFNYLLNILEPLKGKAKLELDV